MQEAYGTPMATLGQGGSIPLCNVFADTYPDAEIILMGVEEPLALIHAPNESVDPSEIERLALTRALFLRATLRRGPDVAAADDLTEYLRVTDTVHVVTTTRDGRTITTPIWAVDVDGVSFIRSVRGRDFQVVPPRHDQPWRRLRDAGRSSSAVELEAIDETDPLEAAVDDALRAKYGRQRSSLASMLTPHAHGTTQRVVPLGRPL